MPAGDGTGPAGMGPMTGRAAGFCAGFSSPGYMNPYGGSYAYRGFGMGRGRGFGRGWGRGFGVGRGRGWNAGYYYRSFPYQAAAPYGYPGAYYPYGW